MLIVISGVSGAAKQRSASFWRENWVGDFLKPTIFIRRQISKSCASVVHLTDEDRWPWLDCLRKQIEQLFAAGENAVLACSALKRAYRDRLRVSDEVKFVFLRGHYALVEKQLRRRRGHFMNPELLRSQFDDLQEPQADEHALTVGLGRTPEEIVEEIEVKLHLANGV